MKKLFIATLYFLLSTITFSASASAGQNLFIDAEMKICEWLKRNDLYKAGLIDFADITKSQTGNPNNVLTPYSSKGKGVGFQVNCNSPDGQFGLEYVEFSESRPGGRPDDIGRCPSETMFNRTGRTFRINLKKSESYELKEYTDVTSFDWRSNKCVNVSNYNTIESGQITGIKAITEDSERLKITYSYTAKSNGVEWTGTLSFYNFKNPKVIFGQDMFVDIDKRP